MKKLLLSIALGGTLLIGEAGVYSGNTSSSFNYKFEIKTNSINPIDEAAGYYYKENMIDYLADEHVAHSMMFPKDSNF